MISPNGGSISDKKILEKPPEEIKKGILSAITGKGYLFVDFKTKNLFFLVSNHFRSFSMLDPNKLKNINNKIFDNKNADKNDNCLITLSSVPEREHEKEDDFKLPSNFDIFIKDLFIFTLKRIIKTSSKTLLK